MKAIYPHLRIVFETGHNTSDLRVNFKDQSGLPLRTSLYAAEERWVHCAA
jgi:hypothetical protein